ncbi:MAG: ABC transporter ATP-binding protein [Phycisphaerae bacterium]|jgi:ABC-2 type transport system ATP-binding protein|nr:ABC transporter ATP-binding protein [Phycisphaerae bacterium]|tara:strand:- start:5648 stop:6568 length:921 start_codon:yes stop_codon:yes gene_type:complete
MPAINLVDIHKTYRGKVHALRGVSLEVNDGEIFGLLGPNGAGKSTLVKIIMTVIYPTRASGTVLGLPIGHIDGLRKIGYLPEHHRFPGYLTGSQVLNYFSALSDVDRSTRKKRSSELLHRLGLGDWGKKKISTYSKGMLQRLGIAQALMNKPQLLILDEPTDGVDPVGRREIRDLLSELKAEGHAIFLNSHLLSELEMVCDRVAIMVKGKVTMQGTIDSLTNESKRIEIEVECSPPDWSHEAFDKVEGHTMTKLGDDTSSVQHLIDRLRAEQCTIRSIKPVRETLEDLFMRAVDHIDNPGSHGGKK